MAITYENYRQMLGVNKHRLDDELEVHADILEKIGSECVRLEARALALKDDLKRVEARIAEEVKDDDAKATVASVESRVIRHRERITAFEAHQLAWVDHAKWERLYEAWKARDFAVRKLADLFTSQYFANDPVVTGEQERRARDREERRTALRQASETRSSAQPEQRRRGFAE